MAVGDQRRVVCIGVMVVDVVGRPVRRLPEAGQLTLVDEMRLNVGGCAVNTAIALARLGVPVEIIGRVGRDALGDVLVSTLEVEGVDARGVTRDDAATTGATMVLVDPDGERRFVHARGANARLTLEDVDFEQIERASILHVGGAFAVPQLDGEPMAEMLRRARAAGVTTSLDTSWDATGRWMQSLGPALPHLDYCVPNLAEARQVTGLWEPRDVAQALVDRGVGTVAITMGRDGCLVVTAAGDSSQVPAFRVEAVDATGAGDAFAGGWLAGVAMGWDLEATARLANALGALCVTRTGATGGVTSLAETLAFMRGSAVTE